MRITGLHLQAYGHFASHSLDFGRERHLSPGLHVVYGHNEAGKSTTLRALSSVLFGYPHQVVDGFRHDAKDIALGIDLLAADGRTLSFVRRRRGKHTLTAADGSALDESVVGNFLGGVSRDVFEKVFALDHHRLRAHAQALLADGGSLGFSLAEAGSGIAGLKAVLDKLKAERGDLFLAAGSRPKLNKAIAEFSRLRKEAKQSTVSPAEYRGHEKGIQETEAELQKTRKQRKEIETGIIRLERIAKNLPLRAEHRVLTGRIEELDAVPDLPPEFAQQRVKACADRDAARDDIAAASAAAEKLEQRIAAISIDADILARSEDIEELTQQRPVIENQEAARPKQEAEREELLNLAAGQMAKAELDGGPADLAGMLPPALKRKAVRTLGAAGKQSMAQRTIALENAENAARALKKAQDRAAQTSKPSPVAALSRALTAANNLGPIAADIAKRTRALERKTKTLSQTISGLIGGLGGDPELPADGAAGPCAAGPCEDRAAVLRELAIPPEKTEVRYADELAALDLKIKACNGEVERLNAEMAETHETIVAMETAGDVATEDDLRAARHARDHGWALVRGLYVDRLAGLDDAVRSFAPDGRVAETYEHRVREADQAVDTLRAHIQESTELALLRRRVAVLDAKKADGTEALKPLHARRDALLTEWRALWPAGLITVQSPGEMVDWLTRRSNALATADELEEEREAIGERVDQEQHARQTLAAAMEAFAAPLADGGFEALRDRARGIIEEAAEAKSRYDSAEASVREMSEQKVHADEAADKVESRIRDWTANWLKALADAGLPADQTIDAAAIDGAAATLEVIDELDDLKSRIDRLNHHIESMRTAGERFGDAVAGVAAALADAPAGTAVQVCRWLEQRLREARDVRTEHKGLAEQLEIRTADRDRANGKLCHSQAALDALCVQAGCADPGELAGIERRSTDKRDALRARKEIETRVREDGGGRDIAALFEECDSVPADQIAADLVSLKADREDSEGTVDKLMAERAKRQAEFDSLLGQNQAADLAQDAESVGAEIEDQVLAYVDLTVQETLLREAINIYRDRNQGPILTRAKNLFVQLTDGAYTGLRADVDGGETILIVEDPSRGSLEIDALSDGTVDAVYLALRLAVVQEHNATHEPLPFVADDLLLNLDNSRSEAALRTLATLAQSSQVLLFTHHAHMLTLARKAVPPGILVEHSLSPVPTEKIEARRAAV
jgi:uncharacterized protein YhaN